MLKRTREREKKIKLCEQQEKNENKNSIHVRYGIHKLNSVEWK